MKRALVLAGVIFGAIASCGGGSPLEGSWVYDTTVLTVPVKLTVTFNGDGTATQKFTSSDCKGAETNSGYSWTATDSKLTFSGAPTCSGTVTCTIGGATFASTCDKSMVKPIGGTCSYVVSSDGNTLTIDMCTGGGSTGASVAYTLKRVP